MLVRIICTYSQLTWGEYFCQIFVFLEHKENFKNYEVHK